MSAPITHLGLDLLRLDGGTQPRAELDDFTVDAYADAMNWGASFPPVVVFYDGTDYWLADGFHRIAALRLLSRTLVESDVRQGTRRDAILYSVGANATHGKPRTNADKRRAVLTLLSDAEWAKWSDREIARQCAVGHAFVSKLRNGSLSTMDSDPRTFTTKHGTVATMNTANIGKARAISPEVRAAVRDTPVVENPDEVRKLAALRPATQVKVAEKIAAGEAASVQEAKFAVKQEEKRAVAERIAAEPPPPPSGPYRVIVADPPWRYEKRAEDATHRSVLPYPDMSTDEICALPVGTLACDDAILWLWTTNAFMRDAFRVLDAWGFAERTILTWVKSQMSTGDWLRGRTEHCILAVRGRPTVTLTNQTTVIEAPRREHSRKPDEFFAMVDTLCPGSKVELFSREPRDGWAAWGAEVGKFQGAA